MRVKVMKTSQLAIIASFFVVLSFTAKAYSSPPSVKTGTATLTYTDYFTFSVEFTGTVNPNGENTYYGFEYGQTKSYGYSTSSISAGSGTSNISVSVNVSGDIFNTPDHFRIFAYNKHGTSYGNDVKIPDAFEPNNQWQEATDFDDIIPEAINNFHSAGDIDWIKIDIIGTANVHYLQFYDVGEDSDISIGVYIQEDTELNLIAESNDSGVGESESVSIDPPINDILYIKVTTLAFGDETEYKLSLMAAICDVGFLTGTVSDASTGEPVVGASVNAEGLDLSSSYDITSLPDGTYYQVACVDSYEITASAQGYNTFYGSTDIPSALFTRVYDISLTPIDYCPNDPNKTSPGICGCGTDDIDLDQDGVYTCQGDECDSDPNKTSPGICGCGEPDTDNEPDGMVDCWEIEHGLNININDADYDPDGDQFTNLLEFLRDTDPNDPDSHPSRALPWMPLLLDND